MPDPVERPEGEGNWIWRIVRHVWRWTVVNNFAAGDRYFIFRWRAERYAERRKRECWSAPLWQRKNVRVERSR